MTEKTGKRSIGTKDTSYLGKKIKRYIDENPTTDNSYKNEKYSVESPTKENIENDKTIYVKLSKKIQESELKNLFHEYGKIKKVIIKSNIGYITFCEKESAKDVLNDERKIYKKYKLSIGYGINLSEISDKDKEEETIHLEEDEDEDIKTTYTKNNKKNKNEEGNEDNSRNNKRENLMEITYDKTKLSNEVSTQISSLKDIINTLVDQNKMIIKLQNDMNDMKTAYKKDNKKLMKAIGIIGEMNVQNEKYIENINSKYKLILNSYKVLYIRKLSNLILDELYRRYKKSFINLEIPVNDKKHIVTICKRDIKDIDKNIISLILDFLKHIKYRVSKIIHIEDEEIKFRKEILYEYLDSSNYSKGNSISLKKVASLIFEGDKKKKKKIPKEKEEIYNRIKNLIVDEKNRMNDNEEKEEEGIENAENSEENELEEENEEERIKNILKGDEKFIKINLRKYLDRLLRLMKRNQIEFTKEYKKLKEINGSFLYDSWLVSFKEEDYKKNPYFLNYVNTNAIPELDNMGYIINELLDGFIINFNMKDPNQTEKRIKKKIIMKKK